MNLNKISLFVASTYSFSWLIWSPNFLAGQFDVPWSVNSWLHIFGGIGPFMGALLTTWFFEGNSGIRRYFTEKLFRLPATKWLLIGVGMPIGFFLISAVVVRSISGGWVDLASLGLNSKLPYTHPLLIWIIWCVFYGLGEEGGWRGYLFPELVKHHEARISTLYVACIWAPWHLPVFFYDKDFQAMGLIGIVGWTVGLTFGSLLLGWLVKRSDWSLWPVILWHGTFNFFTVSELIDPIFPGLMSALVIGFVLWLARKSGEALDQPLFISSSVKSKSHNRQGISR